MTQEQEPKRLPWAYPVVSRTKIDELMEKDEAYKKGIEYLLANDPDFRVVYEFQDPYNNSKYDYHPFHTEMLVRQKTPLMAAAQKGDAKEVARLIAEGALVNACDQDNNSALRYAAHVPGNIGIVRMLLKAGADANAKNDSKSSPLIAACWADREDIEIVNALLEQGADPNEFDPKNAAIVGSDLMPPLSIAAGNGYSGIVKALLEKGANVNQTTEMFKKSALMMTSMNGDTGTMKLLIKAGANIEEADCWGHTPLMHAVIGDSPEAVTLLLANNASLEAKDEKGRTAADIARDGLGKDGLGVWAKPRPNAARAIEEWTNPSKEQQFNKSYSGAAIILSRFNNLFGIGNDGQNRG